MKPFKILIASILGATGLVKFHSLPTQDEPEEEV
jgi:hypothetical protein